MNCTAITELSYEQCMEALKNCPELSVGLRLRWALEKNGANTIPDLFKTTTEKLNHPAWASYIRILKRTKQADRITVPNIYKLMIRDWEAITYSTRFSRQRALKFASMLKHIASPRCTSPKQCAREAFFSTPE